MMNLQWYEKYDSFIKINGTFNRSLNQIKVQTQFLSRVTQISFVSVIDSVTVSVKGGNLGTCENTVVIFKKFMAEC